MGVETMNPGTESYNKELKEWISQESATIDLISSIGHLMYSKSVELVLFRNPLLDKNISEILQLHQYAKDVVKKPINIYDTSELAKELMNLDLAPSKIDIGRLADEWLSEKENFESKADFLNNKLTEYIGIEKRELTPRDVVLYGFGRIGRLAARELIKQAGKGQQLRLRAIVTRSVTDFDINKRAALLRVDSVHGVFREAL